MDTVVYMTRASSASRYLKISTDKHESSTTYIMS